MLGCTIDYWLLMREASNTPARTATRPPPPTVGQISKEAPVTPQPLQRERPTARLQQQAIPQFRDFPANMVHTGSNAPVQLSTNVDWTYRTRLLIASHQKPNYADHFVLSTWGCGTACIQGAAIDVSTGNVVWLPATICCARNTDANFDPVIFKLNSRLIVLSGLRDQKENDDAAHFYSIEGSEFVFVADITRPPL